MHGDPIVAPASGQGAAAVALLRISGQGCHQLLAKVVLGFAAFTPRQLKLSTLKDAKSGETLDEIMAVRFASPHSYTGEDAAEVHCHGGPYVVQRVLKSLYDVGFRAAEPGEFTRRAFLAGKLDLTAAEGIKALAAAASHQQWLAARHLTQGKLKDAIEGLRVKLIEALAYLEAQIDFPDEGEMAALTMKNVTPKVKDAEARIKALQDSYAHGRVASRGLTVALCGEPNAGKSTLMNELLGRERAIVTPIAGTTRDYLEEECLVHGRLIRLIDMAGIRDRPDPVEAIGVASARRLAGEADLVLFLAAADAGDAAARQVEAWEKELKPQAFVKILTKADLGKPAWARSWAQLSCKAGTGIDELRKLLADKVDAHVGDLNKEHAYVTSARQMAALEQATASIGKFHEALKAGKYEEMLAFELQQTVKALTSIVGEIGTEDLLDKIFADFCVGK